MFNGRTMDIGSALEIRVRKSNADFRCAACGQRVRAHKKGTTGQEAHFEHVTANPNCRLSDVR
jgi:competence CoiA-like predicted nuclease